MKSKTKNKTKGVVKKMTNINNIKADVEIRCRVTEDEKRCLLDLLRLINEEQGLRCSPKWSLSKLIRSILVESLSRTSLVEGEL